MGYRNKLSRIISEPEIPNMDFDSNNDEIVGITEQQQCLDKLIIPVCPKFLHPNLVLLSSFSHI